MEHSPAFDRAAALAKAEGAALHIVAFDYLEGLATAGLVNEQALEQMRLGYIERHRQWLEEQARPLRNLGIEVTTRSRRGSSAPCRRSWSTSRKRLWMR